MASTGAPESSDPVAENLYRLDVERSPDPLADPSGTTAQDRAQIAQLMAALAQLREAEQLVSEASRKFMKLSATQMRALHYLIVAKRQGELATPGMLASHLGISAASTTKLLNRLEKEEHIVRRVHPTDRRAFAIEITPATEASARDSVGRLQARRFYAAARLTSEERDVVIRFLHDMADEISLRNAAWAGTEVR